MWINAEKTMIKSVLHHHPLDVKSQVCIEISKIQNLKTWLLSEFILDQGHVLGNANFDPGRQICDFTVFSKVENDYVFFFKLSARTPIKNHSQGIHEKEWH